MSDTGKPARIGEYFKADCPLLIVNLSSSFHFVPLAIYARYPSAPGQALLESARERRSPLGFISAMPLDSQDQKRLRCSTVT